MEWSPGGALLLVSGRVAVVKLGQVETGEIVVFQVRGGTAGQVRARISVRPSETTGCWYSDTFLVSSALQYLAPLTSANKEYAQTTIQTVTVGGSIESSIHKYRLLESQLVFTPHSPAGDQQG